MEKHINEKIVNYINAFKKDIIKLVGETEIEFQIRSKNKEHSIKNVHQIVNYVTEYPMITLEKEDFVKRKRIKNVVPYYDRCIAKRINGQQCTRRKKESDQLCGTHIKGTPHGVIDETEQSNDRVVTLSYCEINGIAHYIDDKENVYHNGDVVDNVKNPRIIAKYIKNVRDNGDVEIVIPEIK